MLSIKIICGIIALLAAWALIFRKQLVYEFNRWMREYAFSDQWVIFSGTRVAVLLFVLGALALFSGIETINQTQVLKPSVVSKMLAGNLEDFKLKKFDRVIQKSQLIIKSYPDNQGAREYLIGAYFATHQSEKAKEEIQNLVAINPNYNFREGFLSPYKIRVVKKLK
jgi:hypothetical protein